MRRLENAMLFILRTLHLTSPFLCIDFLLFLIGDSCYWLFTKMRVIQYASHSVSTPENKVSRWTRMDKALSRQRQRPPRRELEICPRCSAPHSFLMPFASLQMHFSVYLEIFCVFKWGGKLGEEEEYPTADCAPARLLSRVNLLILLQLHWKTDLFSTFQHCTALFSTALRNFSVMHHIFQRRIALPIHFIPLRCKLERLTSLRLSQLQTLQHCPLYFIPLQLKHHP